jgi:GWxTD domain-containing protein
MNLKKTIIILFALLLPLCAQSKSLKINTDCSAFYQNDSLIRWELYYAVQNNVVQYIKDGDQYKGLVEFYVEFIDKKKNSTRDTFLFDLTTLQPSLDYTQDFLGQNSFDLKLDDYKVKITAKDPNSGLVKKIKYDIKSKNFCGNEPKLSDVEILAQLKILASSDSNSSNNFVKKNIYTLPNPYLTVGGTEPEIIIYAEVYDALKYSPDGYEIQFKILDAARKVKDRKIEKRESTSDFIQEYLTYKLESFNSGKFYIEIDLIYETDRGKRKKSSSKKFFLLNPNAELNNVTRFTENLSFEKSEWAVLTEDQLETEFQKARPISSNYEREFFDELSTVDAKQRFMFRFWKTRNPDTAAVINQTLYDYRRNIDKANLEYSSGSTREGWSTDRGRVLLKYGVPTQEDEVLSEGDKRAYITWFYGEQQGGLYFYFVDHTGLRNYELVHSNARGEIYNPGWYQNAVIKTGRE